jgi:hypothetical protein
MYTYPRPHNLAYPARVLSDEGALLEGDYPGLDWPLLSVAYLTLAGSKLGGALRRFLDAASLLACER